MTYSLSMSRGFQSLEMPAVTCKMIEMEVTSIHKSNPPSPWHKAVLCGLTAGLFGGEAAVLCGDTSA